MSNLCSLCIFFCLATVVSCADEQIKVFTVATEPNDGYQRYIRSAQFYNIKVETLGMNGDWHGGNMFKAGGGQKINLLRTALEPYKDDKELLILFTDSYDVIFTSEIGEIIKKFKKFGARILFGAEHYCWPDESLRLHYPSVPAHAARFLNSGMFLGYVNDVYAILQNPIKDNEDDQFYYTQIFLNSETREKHSIQLDHKSEIFQNLHGAENDVKLDINLDTGEGTLYNVNFMTYPSVIHGNGLSKIYLNSFANYLAGTFMDNKCKICEENKIELDDKKLPVVTMALFVDRAVPFFEEFLGKILEINYPKKSINLFIYNKVPFHEDLIQKFITDFGKKYKSTKTISNIDRVSDREGRKLAVYQAEQKKSDYLFSVDADAHLDDSDVLRDLITFNRSFIAPVLVRPNEWWSNFWGALNEAGFYARSHDYVDIVKGNIRGMWNVPYVSSCYLVKSSVFSKMSFEHKTYDLDMALCEQLRNKGVFMYVINTKEYGHLVNYDDFNTDLVRPDFYMLMSNPIDWTHRYIHPEYIQHVNPNYTRLQPCPDVYWFPIVTEKFCTDLIAIMENYGRWSDGSNQDKRLEGGYEAVPTRDIHMNQVGLEKMWLHFLKVYIRPLQEAVFTGYYHNPPRSLMNFVVRYRPDEQPALRPHHDSSTYTINIALNRAGIDYQGGGCHFLRYNCSVKDTKLGWMLLHPGRLTHFHEGLRVTNGTRYIMISFVDP